MAIDELPWVSTGVDSASELNAPTRCAAAGLFPAVTMGAALWSVPSRSVDDAVEVHMGPCSSKPISATTGGSGKSSRGVDVPARFSGGTSDPAPQRLTVGGTAP